MEVGTVNGVCRTDKNLLVVFGTVNGVGDVK